MSLAWVDSGGHKYVVIAGTAKLSNDRAKIAGLWSDWDKAWWEDENDPTIRLITVTPEDGELWDSPNAVVSMAKMAFAAVTGAAPRSSPQGEGVDCNTLDKEAVDSAPPLVGTGATQSRANRSQRAARFAMPAFSSPATSRA